MGLLGWMECSGGCRPYHRTQEGWAGVDRADETYCTALQVVAFGAKEDCMERARVLLDAGADPNLRLPDGSTLLHLLGTKRPEYAGETEHGRWGDRFEEYYGEAEKYAYSSHLAELLLQRGADGHARNGKGMGPLLHAAKQGVTHVVACLLFHGVDPRSQAWGPRRPLYTEKQLVDMYEDPSSV